MAETQLFLLSKGSLLYAPHENGDVAIADSPEVQRVDLICHPFEGSRRNQYAPLIIHAPKLWQVIQKVHASLGSRGAMKQTSELGLSITELVNEIHSQMNQ